MMTLKRVQAEDKEILWNVLQKYLYEMTNYYDDRMDENGNYPYRYFDAYFSDPKRTAYFICDETETVGFAFINPYSSIGREPDHTIAEFTIFPAFRGRHYAREAAEMILAEHPGKWEVKYSEKNAAAKKLWNDMTERYRRERIRLNDSETVLYWCTREMK